MAFGLLMERLKQNIGMNRKLSFSCITGWEAEDLTSIADRQVLVSIEGVLTYATQVDKQILWIRFKDQPKMPGGLVT